MAFKRFAQSALLLFFTAASSMAASYYISPTGNDTTGDGSSGTPWQTISKWMSATGGCGHTLVVKDGSYTQSGNILNPANMPACSSWSSSSTIRAENRYGALFTMSDGLNLQGVTPTETTYYALLDGLIWDNNSAKNISGNKIKFTNCGFKGGQSSGNSSLIEIGNNNFATEGARDILLEDCYVIGYSTGSGRYGVMMYNSDRVTLRRVIVHMDDGWDDGGSANPSANITFYNSQDVLAENCFAIDTRDAPDTYQGQFYLVNNSGQPQVGDNIEIYGSGTIYGQGRGVYFDNGQAYSSVTINDFMIIDSTDAVAGGYGGSVGLTANRWTVVRASDTASGGEAFNYGSAGTKVLKNWIMSGYTGGFTGTDSILTYYDWYNSGTAPANTGEVTYNPRSNGLTNWHKVDAASNLSTAGESGGALGASIFYRIGTDGTLHGESGYRDISATNLWPFPNQAQIKTELCRAYSFGLCSANQTLTQYLTNGFSGTVDTSSPTAPGTPTVTSTGTTTLDLSWSDSTDDVGVTSYEIDVSTDSFSTFSAGYNDFNAGSGTTEQLVGLTPDTAYVFRIRGKDAAGNTSSSSSTGQGATNAQAAATGSSLGFTGAITITGALTVR